MSPSNGPWNLQEAITEQETITQKAGQLLTLDIEERRPPTTATRSQSAKNSENDSGCLRVLAGAQAVKRIDIHHLATTKHEIRLAPPTRATLLFSDPDKESACFLKLCFQSLGDLKAASQAFLRLNLRCTTQFKPSSRTASGSLRIPASPMPGPRGTYPAGGPSYQPWADVRSTPVAARAHSYQPGYAPSYAPHYPPGYSPVAPSLTEYAHPSAWEPGYVDRASPYEPPPPPPPPGHAWQRHASLQRRESSLDSEASFWATARGAAAQSQPLPDRMSYDAAETPEQTAPPPKRALPPSIARHLSQTPGHGSAKKTAEAAVQTENPPRDPEQTLAAGLALFQRLMALQEQMVHECLGAARGLDLQDDEEQASLAAHYAVEFGDRFGQIVQQGL